MTESVAKSGAHSSDGAAEPEAEREALRELSAKPRNRRTSTAQAPKGYSVRLMPGLSLAFFDLAKRLALESRSAAPLDGRLPAATVILAATALESFVNEQMQLASVDYPDKRVEIDRFHEDRTLTLPNRWQRCASILGVGSFTRGRRPFQSFALLVALRNVLVHQAARFRGVDEFPNARVACLEREFAFSVHPSGGELSWDSLILNPHCAKWAVNVAADMINEYGRITWPIRRKGALPVQWEKLP